MMNVKSIFWIKGEESMSLSVIPYLSFNGNCEEAMNTYIEIFGGKVLYLSRWDEKNYKRECQIGKIMHAEFLVGDTRMSGGDSYDCSESNNVKLMVHMATKGEAIRSIAKLLEGGKEIAPLHPHPEPDDGGMGAMIKDKFGYLWIITCPNPDKANSYKST